MFSLQIENCRNCSGRFKKSVTPATSTLAISDTNGKETRLCGKEFNDKSTKETALCGKVANWNHNYVSSGAIPHNIQLYHHICQEDISSDMKALCHIKFSNYITDELPTLREGGETQHNNCPRAMEVAPCSVSTMGEDGPSSIVDVVADSDGIIMISPKQPQCMDTISVYVPEECNEASGNMTPLVLECAETSDNYVIASSLQPSEAAGKALVMRPLTVEYDKISEDSFAVTSTILTYDDLSGDYIVGRTFTPGQVEHCDMDIDVERQEESNQMVNDHIFVFLC